MIPVCLSCGSALVAGACLACVMRNMMDAPQPVVFPVPPVRDTSPGFWGRIDILGHTTHRGYIQGVRVEGCPMLRVRVPYSRRVAEAWQRDGNDWAADVLYGHSAVFSVAPSSLEDIIGWCPHRPREDESPAPPRPDICEDCGKPWRSDECKCCPF